MQYFPGILLAYAAHFLTVVSPGPNVLCLMGTSMSAGRKVGLVYAAGIAVGTLTWGILSVVGLAALISGYAAALYAIKIFGGVYLLWLAFKAFKSSLSESDIEAQSLAEAGSSNFVYFRRAYIINMTNPKAALGWVAIVSLGLSESSPSWVGLAIIAGTFLNSLIIHILFACVFSTELMLRSYMKARRSIQAAMGVVFAFAGYKLLETKVA